MGVAADADVAVHEQDGRPAALERKSVEDGSAKHRGAVSGRVGGCFGGDVDAEGGQTLRLGGAHHAAGAAADIQQRTVESGQNGQVDRVRGSAPTGEIDVDGRRRVPDLAQCEAAASPAAEEEGVRLVTAGAERDDGAHAARPWRVASARAWANLECGISAATATASAAVSTSRIVSSRDTSSPALDERCELPFPGVRAGHRHAADDVAPGLAHAQSPESSVLGHADDGIRIGRPHEVRRRHLRGVHADQQRGLVKSVEEGGDAVIEGARMLRDDLESIAQ